MTNRDQGGKCTFKDSWLTEADVNGDNPRLYVQKTSQYTFKCCWCQSPDLAVDNIGKNAIFQHSKSKKHCHVSDIRTGRVTNQIVFNTQEQEEVDLVNDDRHGENNNEQEDNVDRNDRRGIMNFFKPHK